MPPPKTQDATAKLTLKVKAPPTGGLPSAGKTVALPGVGDGPPTAKETVSIPDAPSAAGTVEILPDETIQEDEEPKKAGGKRTLKLRTSPKTTPTPDALSVGDAPTAAGAGAGPQLEAGVPVPPPEAGVDGQPGVGFLLASAATFVVLAGLTVLLVSQFLEHIKM